VSEAAKGVPPEDERFVSQVYTLGLSPNAAIVDEVIWASVAANFPQRPARLPKLAIAAVIIAFLLAVRDLMSAFQHVLFVVSAVIPALAATSILRKRVWGAYGFALFELAQLAIYPLLLRTAAVSRTQIAAVIGLNLGLALLFFLAGRSLARAGAERGWTFPWIALSCLFTVPFFFFQFFVIPTGGMENTLLLGDRIVVRVFPRVTPARGDIIVFHYPIDRRQTFIKRVIGLPGDRIRIVSQVIYRNGAALTEPYAVHKFNVVDKYRDNFPGNLSDLAVLPGAGEMLAAKDMLQNHVSNGEVVVPPRKYFVLGDNRDNSLDSRYWGFVDASDVIGEPLLIYDSEAAARETPGGKAGSSHRIRWNRLFKVL
jgi:signal peptidase I